MKCYGVMGHTSRWYLGNLQGSGAIVTNRQDCGYCATNSDTAFVTKGVLINKAPRNRGTHTHLKKVTSYEDFLKSNCLGPGKWLCEEGLALWLQLASAHIKARHSGHSL